MCLDMHWGRGEGNIVFTEDDDDVGNKQSSPCLSMVL